LGLATGPLASGAKLVNFYISEHNVQQFFEVEPQQTHPKKKQKATK